MVRSSMANFEYQIRFSLADWAFKKHETVFRGAWVRGSTNRRSRFYRPLGRPRRGEARSAG